MERISQEELDEVKELGRRAPKQALKHLTSYEQRYSDDIVFQRNHGGLLIDIGAAVRDPHVVKRGIDVIEQMLPRIEQGARPTHLYNLGNGFYVLDAIARGRPSFSFHPDDTPLVEAKRYYRQALEEQQHLGAQVPAQLRVNYGNCLAHLGRSVEAISEYDRAITVAPEHPMAWGNLGIELEPFAFVANNLTLLRDAQVALTRALANDQIERLGGSQARVGFRRAWQRVKKMIAGISPASASSVSEVPPGHSQNENPYVQFCLEHQLFLNFDIKSQSHYHPTDAIALSLKTDLNDRTTFPRLARVMNDLKERYAAARLLIYEALNPPYSTRSCDDMTYYVDNLDYAVYGVRPAKLKAAYESAYNTLDKMAVFMNDYLNLQMNEKRTYFSTIWKQPEGSGLREEIAMRNNYHLYGLYDISRDLAPPDPRCPSTAGWFYRLHEMRNLLTHRYLVLHDMTMAWLTEADGDEYHIGYREFFNRTIQLMQLVRSAVIYLIAAVDQEERKKHPRGKGIIARIPVPRCEHYGLGPHESGA